LGAVGDGFARVPIAAPAMADGVADAAAAEPGFAVEPAMAVEFSGKSLPSGCDPRVRVGIPGSVSAGSTPAFTAAVVTALSRRCSRFDPAFGCGRRLGTAIGGAA
jgi:hypothetical protein